MTDWPPYVVDGRWVRDAVTRRQRDRAQAHAALHGWPLREIDLLTDPVDEAFVARFEAEFGVALPSGYRSFLTEVGDGGRGPGVGMRHLGRPLDDAADWTFGTIETDPEMTPDVLLGQVCDWVTGGPAERDPGGFAGGVLYLFDYGCALWDVLVVTGPSRGQIWSDRTADGRGVHPVAADVGSFAAYYCRWLDAPQSEH